MKKGSCHFLSTALVTLIAGLAFLNSHTTLADELIEKMLDKFPGGETLAGFGMLDTVCVKRCAVLAIPQTGGRSARKMEKGCRPAENNQQHQHGKLTLGGHPKTSLRHSGPCIFAFCALG